MTTSSSTTKSAMASSIVSPKIDPENKEFLISLETIIHHRNITHCNYHTLFLVPG